MKSDLMEVQAAGQRGPAEHTIRAQIISAAEEHFKHFGFAKTTVSDLAKAIGFSKAYIYKFFDSKQAIGEAICANCLDIIATAASDEVKRGRTATAKLRGFFRAIVEKSSDLFFREQRLFEIAASSTSEKWASSRDHQEKMLALLTSILAEGRASGEFERKTPLDETARAITHAMQPFTNPLMLVHNLDTIGQGPTDITNLVLRSLAP